MRAVSGRYTNPFRAGRRRASSATSYLQLPDHEPRASARASDPNHPSDTPLPPYTPPVRRKSSPSRQSPITVGTLSLSTRSWRTVFTLLAFILGLGLFVELGGRHTASLQSPPKHQQAPLTPWDPVKDPRPPELQDPTLYPWLHYPVLSGLYNGVRTLVPFSQWIPEPDQAQMFAVAPSSEDVPATPPSAPLPLTLRRYDPYPDYDSKDYLTDYSPVQPCFLDANETRPAPDIFAYPGVPQHMTAPLMGSYEELGLPPDICFERYGRFGPYGYGYAAKEGGLDIGLLTERADSEKLWAQQSPIDYRGIDWGDAQRRCLAKNINRYRESEHKSGTLARLWSGNEKKKLPRTAYVLRAWTGFKYTPWETMYLRAMINELALKSGGEYDVHLLLHVIDESIPIWTDKKLYQKIIEDNIPKEFWGITTLWSVPLMRLFYPGPMETVFDNPSGHPPHGVYRAQHLAIQWFGNQHPEYDFVWNWEMDIRYSGHLYEFHQKVADWAKEQPRRGLWERNSRFWIPAKHGNYSDFIQLVDEEIRESGEVPVWGPTSFPNRGRVEPPPEVQPPHGWFEDNFKWGVGEEADLITFNPIFDPGKTNWFFRDDITGYSLDLPIPPRRCAIVTVARLSRRLLDLMHQETYLHKHTAFPEMWPATVALHQGLKAVYIPHPIYFSQQWPVDVLDQVYNHPMTPLHSVFGWGEHNQLGNSFYYNSLFSGKLWRRWLGEIEDKSGGAIFEENHTGRMCLRPILHHPIKREDSAVF